MANKTASQLTTLSGVASDDLLVIYDTSESGNEKLKKMEYSNFQSELNIPTDYLAEDGSTPLTGDWNFGSQTISGTGDIWCNEIHTAVAIGESTVYEETLVSGTDTITLDFDHGDSGHAYIDGVRQKSSAYTFSGDRDVIFAQELPSDTEIIFEGWI